MTVLTLQQQEPRLGSKIPVGRTSPTSTNEVLSIQQIKKQFPLRRSWRQLLLQPRGNEKVAVLRDVSFSVRQGEIFGLLGPNGAGKTTLLKILGTLILPDAGTITVAGHDLVRDAGRVRTVLASASVDERSLNWRLSARENLRFFATLHGFRGPALRDRVMGLLAAVELADTGEKMVGQFSSGMRQRLLIARALIPQPRILLLDEPTRSLDPVSADRFRKLLRQEIVERQGCTVLLATHNPEEALGVCDRLGVLNQGRMIKVGRPGELADGLQRDRFRVWTRSPNHPAFASLEQLGSIVDRQLVQEGQWSIVEFTIPGAAERAANVLSYMVGAGIMVSRFEKTSITLAALIQGVVSADAQHA